MTEHPTLRALAGLPQQPVGLAESTLIMIDCQNTYTRGPMELVGVQEALDQAAELLDRARSAGIPIVHIQHDDGEGSIYDVRGESGAIVDRVAPRGDEPVIVKNRPNAFVGTDLEERCAKSGQDVVLAGFMTHMCISASARAALDLGYQATVPADATATRALPAHDGGAPIDARTVHRTALAELADRFAAVVSVGEIAA